MSVPVHARGLILAVSCLSLAPVETRAQTLPKHFLGVWIVDAGDDRACKSAEWKNARQDYHINITPNGIDFWETRCQFNSVRATEKSGNDPATLPCRVVAKAAPGRNPTFGSFTRVAVSCC